MFVLSLIGRRDHMEKYSSHLQQSAGCYYKRDATENLVLTKWMKMQILLLC